MSTEIEEFEEERELTPEEEKLVHDYILSNCSDEEKVWGEHLAQKILSKNPIESYCRMMYLKYAQEGRKMTPEQMDWAAYWD